MRKLLFASAVFLLAVPGASAQFNPHASAPDPTRNAPDDSQLDRDKEFAKKLFKSDKVAIAMGEMAQQNSQSDVIKQFSRGMVDERKKLDTTLDPVARQVGLHHPEKAKENKEVAKLKSLTGAAFDKEFLNLMLKLTQQELKDSDVEANKTGNIGLRQIALANSTAATQRIEQLKVISSGGSLAQPDVPSAQGVPSAQAQEVLPSPLQPARAVSQKSPEGLVHLDVAVRDKAGKPVAGLTEKDFTLLDNGVPQTIVSFRAPGQSEGGKAIDANARLGEVVFVLDQVNLKGVEFGDVKKFVIAFLQQNGGHLAVPTSVYLLTRGGLEASTKPMMDGNALAELVGRERLPRVVWESEVNGHKPADAWDDSLKTIYSLAVERSDVPGRKVVVWMGYGWLTRSLTQPAKVAFDSLTDLSTRLREARVAVCQIPIWPSPSDISFDYTGYLKGPRSPKELEWPNNPNGYFALPVLALQTGGTIQNASHEPVRDISKCLDEASPFYGLSFNPAHAANPNEYHELKVETSAAGSTTLTSTGYYNQPAFYDQPRVPTRLLSVKELEAMLASDSGDHEGALADQLEGLELTERLSTSRIEQLRGRLHGNKSKEALTALADASVFLAPPAEDVLPDPAPSHDELVAMLSKTVKYVDQTMTHLPDLSATRVVEEYKQRSQSATDTWKTALADQSLHEEITERERVQYRDGHEVRDDEKKKGGRGARGKELDFIGVFGPILHSVMSDATRNNGTLKWARWERGPQGREAVISYEVPGKNSSYDVVHCCVRGSKYFRDLPPYRGEIAIDPATGTILRLTMAAVPGWIVEPNLHPVLPVETTGMMVEYGRVSIGTRDAVCPVRSIVLMRTRTVRQWTLWEDPVEVYAPYQTQLNDIVYTDYRKFGSEAKILFGAADPTNAPSEGGERNSPSPQLAPKF